MQRRTAPQCTRQFPRGRVPQQDDEFIPTEAGHGNVSVFGFEGLQRARQFAGDGPQHGITDGVSEGVVYSLEAVEVQVMIATDSRNCVASRTDRFAVSMQRCRFGRAVSGSK